MPSSSSPTQKLKLSTVSIQAKNWMKKKVREKKQNKKRIFTFRTSQLCILQQQFFSRQLKIFSYAFLVFVFLRHIRKRCIFSKKVLWNATLNYVLIQNEGACTHTTMDGNANESPGEIQIKCETHRFAKRIKGRSRVSLASFLINTEFIQIYYMEIVFYSFCVFFLAGLAQLGCVFRSGSSITTAAPTTVHATQIIDFLYFVEIVVMCVNWRPSIL